MITGATRRRIAVNGDEADLYSRRWRRWVGYSKMLPATKRATHKRERREGRAESRE